MVSYQEPHQRSFLRKVWLRYLARLPEHLFGLAFHGLVKREEANLTVFLRHTQTINRSNQCVSPWRKTEKVLFSAEKNG